MINLVIGYYSGYFSLDTDKGGLRVFVESFRKYNKSDLIIVCYTPPIICEELKEFCESNNCLIKEFNLEDVKTGNRWKAYNDIISDVKIEIKNILIADMNDAIFQSNPFEIQINGLYCACEKTIYQIFEDPNLNNYNSLNINTTWMNNTGITEVIINNNNLKKFEKKNQIENNIFGKPILCSGTILGSAESIKNLLEWGSNKNGADQGLLNIYAYNILKEEQYFAPPLEYSDILTMDSVEFNSLKKDKQGFILNNNNKKYSICHQIDRGGNLEYFINLANK